MFRVLCLFSFLVLASAPLSRAADLGDVLGIGRALIEMDQRSRQQQQQPQAAQPQPTRPQPVTVAREDVRTLQSRLAELGYDPGPADGLMGRRTSSAIAAFERDQGMPQTGQPSPTVISAVGGAWAARVGTQRRLYGETPSEAPARTTAAAPTPAAGPSFDCARAGTPTERAICGDAMLARLDRDIAASYAAALASAGPAEADRIRAEQRAWIGQRDGCGGDGACLSSAMTSRNFALSRTLAGAPPATVAAGQGGVVEDAPGMVVQDQRGLITIDGRIVHFVNNAPRDFDMARQADLLGTQLLSLSMPRPVRFAGPQDPSLAAIGILPPDEIVALARQALGQEPRTLASLMSRPQTAATMAARGNAVRSAMQVGDMGTEFQIRAFLDAAAPRVEAALDAQRPATPLRLRLYCNATLPSYDFGRQAFPLDAARLQRDCGVRGFRLATGQDMPGSFTPPPLPAAIPMPVDQAEAFRNRFMVSDGRGGLRPAGMLAVLDVDFAAIQGTDRYDRPATVLQGRHVGGMSLVRSDAWQNVVYRFAPGDMPQPEPDEASKMAALAAAEGRLWNLSDPLELEALGRRVGWVEPAALSLDALSDLTGESLLHQHIITPDGAAASDLAQALRLRDDRAMRALADRLGLPRDHLVPLDPGGGNTGAVVLALPRPAGSYGFDIPAPLQGVSHFPFRLTLAAQAGGWSDMPDRGGVLLLRARPVSIALLPKGDGQGRYDAPPVATVALDPDSGAAPAYERVAILDTVGLAVHVARSEGADLTDFMFRQLTRGGFARDDAFARRDEAVKLAAAVPASLDATMAAGTIRLGSYDFGREAYKIENLYLDLRQDGQYSARGSLSNGIVLRIADQYDMYLPVPADQARAWQDSNPSHPDYALRAGLDLGAVETSGQGDYSNHTIAATVRSMELLVPDAEIGLRDPRDVVLTVSLAPEAAPAPAEPDPPPPSAPVDPLAEVPFDILGLRLGQDLAAAVETVIGTIGAEATLRMTRQAWIDHYRDGQPRVLAWSPFREAVLLAAPDASDIVTLFHEPGSGIDGRLGAVARSRLYPDGAGPGMEQLRQLLADKYGAPAATREAADGFEVMVWVSDPPEGEAAARSLRCENEVARNTAGNQVNIRDDLMLRETPNRPHWLDQPWLDGSGQKVLPPRENPPDLSVIFQQPLDCDRGFVTAMLEPATDGRVRVLRMVLVHPNEIFRQSEALRQRLESAPPAAEGEDAPAFKL